MGGTGPPPAPRPLPGRLLIGPPPPQILFVVQNPDVFKSPASDTYVVFGEAKIEDLSQQQHMQQAQQMAAMQQAAANQQDIPVPEKPDAPEDATEEAADGDDEDETGVEAKDIELVMQQANVARAKAVKALKKNNNDIVTDDCNGRDLLSYIYLSHDR